jgi:hypothetical protein
MTATTDAYAAVADLHARYSIALDRRQPEALLRCFVDEAVLRVGGRDAASSGQAIASRLLERAPVGVVHSVSTITVAPAHDDGAGRWSSTAYFQLHDAETGTLTGLGSYDDDIEITDGTARYVARNVAYLWRSSP